MRRELEVVHRVLPRLFILNFGKDNDESTKSGGIYTSLVEIILSNFNITMKKEGSFEAEFVEELKNRVRAYLLPLTTVTRRTNIDR